jgi:hypothetical protein
MIAGKFKAVVTAKELTTTRNGGEQVVVTFELREGPSTGETIKYYGNLSAAAAEYTLKNLRICGWKSDDIRELDTVGDDEVQLNIQEDTYNGNTALKVKFINPLTMASKFTVEPSQADALAARLKALAAATRGDTPAAPAVAPRTVAATKPNGAAPAVVDADELPF